MSAIKEAPVAKKKPPVEEAELKSARVIFLAGQDWVKRMTDLAESLGLSLAAFIRLCCEEKARRMSGKPDGT